MRLKITLAGEGKAVPLRYLPYLQAAIYHMIEDETYQDFLHNQGFTHGNKNFKLFTFSSLLGRGKVNPEAKTITFADKITWIISSQEAPLLDYLFATLLNRQQVQIGRTTLQILGIERIDVQPKGEVIRMLSPIVAYQTVVFDDGRQGPKYYTPFDPQFTNIVVQNAVQKYEAYYGEKPAGTLTFGPLKVEKRDQLVTMFKKNLIRGWRGEYQLTGDAKLLAFLTNVGLGSKNSAGFGLFEWKR